MSGGSCKNITTIASLSRSRRCQLIADNKLSYVKGLSAKGLWKHNPFVFCTNTYPHQTSYRTFSNPCNLNDLWRHEDTNHLFLNLHIPFRTQRCGFCNDFSKIGKISEFVDPYLEQMESQANVVNQILRKSNPRPFHIDHIAISGGSPNLLSVDQLDRTLNIVEEVFQTPLKFSDLSIELYPSCTEEILETLLERFTMRLSIGVQSFLSKDLKRLYTNTPPEQIHENLGMISSMGFPQVNIDLIYGIADQSETDFLKSIDNAIRYEPDEYHLYPLYTLHKTDLEENYKRFGDNRLKLYQAGRNRLLEAGFFQDSMRRFVKKRTQRTNTSVDIQKYGENINGMIGLGCGSRSLTKNVHYSETHAITQTEIHQILQSYIDKSPADFAYAHYGIALTEEDKRRRFILKSLLMIKGLDTDSYRREFHEEPLKEIPEILGLLENDLAHKNGSFIVLTDKGISFSDIIGPWLHSHKVIELMEETGL